MALHILNLHGLSTLCSTAIGESTTVAAPIVKQQNARSGNFDGRKFISSSGIATRTLSAIAEAATQIFGWCSMFLYQKRPEHHEHLNSYDIGMD
jgi:hypothetical protein